MGGHGLRTVHGVLYSEVAQTRLQTRLGACDKLEMAPDLIDTICSAAALFWAQEILRSCEIANKMCFRQAADKWKLLKSVMGFTQFTNFCIY